LLRGKRVVKEDGLVCCEEDIYYARDHGRHGCFFCCSLLLVC